MPPHRRLVLSLSLLTSLLLGVLPACNGATGNQYRPSGDDDDTGDDDSSPVANDCATLEVALTDLASWPVLNSCGYFFSASTAANDYRLAVSFDVTQSTTPVEGMSFVVSLDGSTVANLVTGSLQTQTGSNLNVWDCNDALDPTISIVVSEEWNPVAGTATLQVTAVDGEAWPGGPTLFTGDVILQGVGVELGTQQGTTCTVPDTTWTDRAFGWLPG